MSITGAPPSSHMCHAYSQTILQKTHSVIYFLASVLNLHTLTP